MTSHPTASKPPSYHCYVLHAMTFHPHPCHHVPSASIRIQATFLPPPGARPGSSQSQSRPGAGPGARPEARQVKTRVPITNPPLHPRGKAGSKGSRPHSRLEARLLISLPTPSPPRHPPRVSSLHLPSDVLRPSPVFTSPCYHVPTDRIHSHLPATDPPLCFSCHDVPSNRIQATFLSLLCSPCYDFPSAPMPSRAIRIHPHPSHLPTTAGCKARIKPESIKARGRARSKARGKAQGRVKARVPITDPPLRCPIQPHPTASKPPSYHRYVLHAMTFHPHPCYHAPFASKPPSYHCYVVHAITSHPTASDRIHSHLLTTLLSTYCCLMIPFSMGSSSSSFLPGSRFSLRSRPPIRYSSSF